MPEKVVLIGGSHAAVSVIETFRSEGFRGHLTLVSEEKLPSFSPTALPYLFGDKEKPGKTLRPLDFYRGVAVIEQKAVSVHPNRSTVVLKSGERIRYDRLVLATGASAKRLSVDGSHDSILTLRNMRDLDRIEKQARKSRSIVILGAGLVGLHMAEVLSGKGKEILVLETADQILPGMVHRELAAALTKIYEQGAIRIRVRTSIHAVHGKQAVLSTGESVGADMILAAVGVQPNTEVVQDTGVAVQKGILVNGNMETNLPGIYACGDVAEHSDFFTGKSRLNPSVVSAAEQGRRVAETIMGIGEQHSGSVAVNTFRCMGSPLLSMGRIEPDPGDRMLEEMDEEKVSFKRLVFKNGTLKGMLLLNCPADGGIFYNLVRRRSPLKGMEEEIFGDPMRWGRRLAGRS